MTKITARKIKKAMNLMETVSAESANHSTFGAGPISGADRRAIRARAFRRQNRAAISARVGLHLVAAFPAPNDQSYARCGCGAERSSVGRARYSLA
jgi:hypothetical protein